MSENIKRILWALGLTLAVVPLAGCLDAGLNFTAKRHAQDPRNQIQEESIEIPGLNETIEGEDLTAPLDDVTETDISHFFDGLREDIEADSGESESLEEAEELATCDDVNTAEEGCNEVDEPVCAKLEGTMNGEESSGWFNFKNACIACKKSQQKIGGNTLIVAGYKEGKCSEN